MLLGIPANKSFLQELLMNTTFTAMVTLNKKTYVKIIRKLVI